jgi:hypothetical protein
MVKASGDFRLILTDRGRWKTVNIVMVRRRCRTRRTFGFFRYYRLALFLRQYCVIAPNTE